MNHGPFPFKEEETESWQMRRSSYQPSGWLSC